MEMKNAVAIEERRQIQAELEFAQAELAEMLAEQDDSVGVEPPF